MRQFPDDLAPRILECRFVQRNHNWLNLTRQLISDSTAISWQAWSDPDQLPADRFAGSLVVLEFAEQATPALLRNVYRIYSNHAWVAVVGLPDSPSWRLELTMSGACCLISGVDQCPRLAEVIVRLRDLMPPQLTDYREQVRSRIPWNAGS